MAVSRFFWRLDILGGKEQLFGWTVFSAGCGWKDVVCKKKEKKKRKKKKKKKEKRKEKKEKEKKKKKSAVFLLKVLSTLSDIDLLYNGSICFFSLWIA